MRNIPENYTPAKPSGSCGHMANGQMMCAAKKFMQKPSGLGMNNVMEMMDALFAQQHNTTGKGIEVERVGEESEMNKLLGPILKGIQ